MAFNRHGSLADTDRTGGLDSTVDPGWAGADRSERYSSAPDAYSSTGAYSSAGAYSSRRNLDAVPFWTTGYDDERLTQTRRPILPRLAEFRARPRRSPLLPVVAFVLGLALSLAPFYQRLSAGIEDVQAGRFGGANLLTDGEALEAALSRFSQRTGVTGVCRLLVSDEYVSLQAPKPDGAPGQDDYIVKLNSDRIWSESADCDHELIALAEVDAAVISAAYGRAVDEAGFTAEDINPDKGTAQVARNVVGPEQILIRVNVYAPGHAPTPASRLPPVSMCPPPESMAKPSRAQPAAEDSGGRAPQGTWNRLSAASVMSICPGAWAIARLGRAASSAACGVTPQAQNTGMWPSGISTASP